LYWNNQHPFGSGEIVKLTPGAASPTVLVNGLSYSLGVGVDLAGNLYYDEYVEGILYELPAGSSTPKVLATGLNYPDKIYPAANGTVFLITGQGCGNEIVRFNPTTGSLTTILTLTSPNTDYGFGGLFIDPAGNLYYTTCAYGTVNLLPAGSSTPQTLLTIPVTQRFQWPNGVAADASGNVFFTVYGQSVQVLPKGSSTPEVLVSEPAFTDGFAHQTALDSSDDVYFTDSYAGDVWEIPVSAAVSSTIASFQPFSQQGPISISKPANQLQTAFLWPLGSNGSFILFGVIAGLAVAIVVIILMRRRKGGIATFAVTKQPSESKTRTKSVDSIVHPQVVREVIKEKEMVREVFIVKCPHCKTRYQENLGRCPYCGAAPP
jgi:hypothetical protein